MPTTHKKTKIVATIGPATEKEEMLEKLALAGMNVIRLNFSHGDFAEHEGRVHAARSVMKKTGLPLALLQDLAGPKIRTQGIETPFMIEEGKMATITTELVNGTALRFSINYPKLHEEVKPGINILLHDGKLRLEVVSIKGKDIQCKVLVGGEVKDKKGVNVPGAFLTINSITEKDRHDVQFAAMHDFDYVALSFVRKPEDIDDLRRILAHHKSDAGIVAKIETAEAVMNIDAIIERVDAIMVARGDLAIEIGAENVPMVQKQIINKCNKAGKPVIVATQMLESMINSPVPTRAEVSDVANALIDGTDAVMLSEETTLGKYPLQAVKVMARVAAKIESEYVHEQFLVEPVEKKPKPKGIGESITASAVRTAHRVGAKFIVTLTESGYSARMISRYKPVQPMLVCTPNRHTYFKSSLFYGSNPLLIERFQDLGEVLKIVRHHCLEKKLAATGDRVVIAAAMPFGAGLETNMLVVETL